MYDCNQPLLRIHRNLKLKKGTCYCFCLWFRKYNCAKSTVNDHKILQSGTNTQTLRKIYSTLTATWQLKYNWGKATSTLFLNELIAKFERALSTALQNKDPKPQNQWDGLKNVINNGFHFITWLGSTLLGPSLWRPSRLVAELVKDRVWYGPSYPVFHFIITRKQTH